MRRVSGIIVFCFCRCLWPSCLCHHGVIILPISLALLAPSGHGSAPPLLQQSLCAVLNVDRGLNRLQDTSDVYLSACALALRFHGPRHIFLIGCFPLPVSCSMVCTALLYDANPSPHHDLRRQVFTCCVLSISVGALIAGSTTQISSFNQLCSQCILNFKFEGGLRTFILEVLSETSL